MLIRHTKELGLGFGIMICLAGYVACSSSSSPASETTHGPDGSTTAEGGGGEEAGDGGTGADTSTGPAKPFHAVTGAQSDDRITGVYCPTTKNCVIATESSGGTSHVNSIDANTVNPTPLVTADDAFSTTAGVVGTVGFLGFSKVGGLLIARTNPGGSAFVSASADPLLPASWSVAKVGTVTGGSFTLNAEYGFGVKGTDWIQVRNSFVYTAPAAPAPGTAWTKVWSPGGNSQIPADLVALHTADPTLCLSEVSISFSPRPTQSAYVAPDGAIVMYQAHGLNQQQQDDKGGVCISTDGGKRFHFAALPGLAADINGPTALTCTSKDHCVVGGGMAFTTASSYMYVSDNASMGVTSTWTAAKIPATTDNTFPYEIFFAPDGTTGWVVGKNDTGPLLWSTIDGGANWTDQTASVAAFTDRAIWSGYAVDATHVVLGSENGKIISNF